MKTRELTKEQFDSLPKYEGKYLHYSFVVGIALYKEQKYLIANMPATGETLVGSDTVIANMVGYYGINEVGKPVDSQEWKVSDGQTTVIRSSNRVISQKLPKGTKYLVVKPISVVDDVVNQGTLAVHYPDVGYPSI